MRVPLTHSRPRRYPHPTVEEFEAAARPLVPQSVFVIVAIALMGALGVALSVAGLSIALTVGACRAFGCHP